MIMSYLRWDGKGKKNNENLLKNIKIVRNEKFVKIYCDKKILNLSYINMSNLSQ